MIGSVLTLGFGLVFLIIRTVRRGAAVEAAAEQLGA